MDSSIQTSGLGLDEMKRLPEAKPGSNLFNSTLVEAKHISFCYPTLFSVVHTLRWLVKGPQCIEQTGVGEFTNQCELSPIASLDSCCTVACKTSSARVHRCTRLYPHPVAHSPFPVYKMRSLVLNVHDLSNKSIFGEISLEC
jgi:hypothetical protein